MNAPAPSRLVASRRSIKNPSADLLRGAGGPVRWPDVLRALEASEARSAVLSRYREAGHTPDAFARRRAREAMADALTAGEDWLDREHPGRLRERAALASVRRRLEWELWS